MRWSGFLPAGRQVVWMLVCAEGTPSEVIPTYEFKGFVIPLCKTKH